MTGVVPVTLRQASVNAALKGAGHSIRGRCHHFHSPRRCCVASDKKCQQSTNPYLGLQNKDKGLNPSLTALLLSSLLPVSPLYTPSLPPPHCLAVYTHSCPYGEAWLGPLSLRLSPLSAPGRGGRIIMSPTHFKNALLSSTLSFHISCFVLLPLWSRTICCTE